jgi:hypothetical protein
LYNAALAAVGSATHTAHCNVTRNIRLVYLRVCTNERHVFRFNWILYLKRQSVRQQVALALHACQSGQRILTERYWGA